MADPAVTADYWPEGVAVELSVNGRAVLVDRCYVVEHDQSAANYVLLKLDGRVKVDLKVALEKNRTSFALVLTLFREGVQTSIRGSQGGLLPLKKEHREPPHHLRVGVSISNLPSAEEHLLGSAKDYAKEKLQWLGL